jgi:putative ABC transport system permease protein
MEAVSEEMIWTTKVTGTLPEYFVMRDWPIAHGTVFSASDVGGKAPVAVLGDKVATNLFAAGVDPVGQTIRLRKIAFTVIGVTAHKGLARSGLDQDDVVFVPATTFRARLQPGNPKALAGIIMFSSPRLDDAMTSVESLLRDRHLLGPEMDDDFEIGRFEE